MSKCMKLFVMAALIVCLTWGITGSALALEGKAGEVIKTEAELKELNQKGLLSDAFVIDFTELVQNNIPIPIVATSDRSKWVSPGYVAATEKHKGEASVDANGIIKNHSREGGRPFPDLKPDDPQIAIKAAWNFEFRHVGDSFSQEWDYFLVDAKKNVKRLWGGGTGKLLFNYRTDLDPKPQLDPAINDVREKSITLFMGPFSSKGLSQLSVKYIDTAKDKDFWTYVPGLRRALRQGGGNRCDSLGGFVPNMDDDYGFSADVTGYTWKFMGAKEMLVPAALEKAPPAELVEIPKGFHTPKVKLERRQVWIIEATPKDKDYCYSKRLWFLDPETFQLYNSHMYDKNGKLWKNYWGFSAPYVNPPKVGGITQVFVGGACSDFRIWEGGPWVLNPVKANVALRADDFSLDWLRRQGR